METIKNDVLDHNKSGLKKFVCKACDCIKNVFKSDPIPPQCELDFNAEQRLRHYMLVNNLLAKDEVGPIYEMKFAPKNASADATEGKEKEMDYSLGLILK